MLSVFWGAQLGSFKKLVAFDLDGTLNMTHVYAVLAYQRALEELGAGTFTEEEIKSRFGAPFREDCIFFFGTQKEELFIRFYDTIGKYWYPLMEELAVAYPGVPAMLEELKRDGCELAVCSNADIQELNRVLKKLEIWEYFDEIQGLTEKNDKVHSLNTLLERVKPDWCCMVGDRYYDQQAALKNGVDFIGCSYGYGSREELKGCLHLVQSCGEIPAQVQLLSKKGLLGI